MSGLTEYSKTYKPFQYAWAMEASEEHEKIHWGTWEVKLQEDVNQWNGGEITPQEKDFVTQILRIFTQSDVAVGGTRTVGREGPLQCLGLAPGDQGPQESSSPCSRFCAQVSLLPLFRDPLRPNPQQLSLPSEKLTMRVFVTRARMLHFVHSLQ